MSLRAIEFFSGLGGWRCALDGRAEVVAAYDINPHANRAYALNHGMAPMARELATIPARELHRHDAALWLMSPPCQPYCRMGNRGDLADLRSRAFVHLMDCLPDAAPGIVIMENVEGFLGSDSHALFLARCSAAGLGVTEFRLCPTRFGVPNQRPRVYLIAASRPVDPGLPPACQPHPLEGFLDPVEDPGLYLTPALLARHRPGLDLVRAGDTRSACFIGGYGRRLVGSGSFLVTSQGIRRFSPAEVARLLGYPPAFAFPPELPFLQRYKLLGNGLSLRVALWVLSRIL